MGRISRRCAVGLVAVLLTGGILVPLSSDRGRSGGFVTKPDECSDHRQRSAGFLGNDAPLA